MRHRAEGISGHALTAAMVRHRRAALLRAAGRSSGWRAWSAAPRAAAWSGIDDNLIPSSAAIALQSARRRHLGRTTANQR